MTTETRSRAAAPASGAEPADEAARLEASLPRRSAFREVWVGVFVIAGIVAVLTALFTLTDAALFRGRYFVNAVVQDAGGIRKGDPVQMRGVNIGRVNRFVIAPGGVAIRMEIEGEYGIPEGSRVVLESGGLLGGMIAEIVPGRSDVRVESGDTLPATSNSGLTETASAIGERADNVLARVEGLLSQETITAVNDGAVELHSVLAESSALVAEQRSQLSALVASLRQSAEGLEEAAAGGSDIASAAARVDTLTARLDATAISLHRSAETLETVLSRLARGEGTLGRLATDESLYRNLNAAAENIALLAEDVRANPSRYINVEIF